MILISTFILTQIISPTIDRVLMVLRGAFGLYQHVVLSFHFNALVDMWMVVFGVLSVYLERRDSSSLSQAVIKQYARLLTNPFGTVPSSSSHVQCCQ